ncbi:MAG: SixA phosphatase family protein [Betaproteobacteria bacterium]|jgi:phosphohistidine phosphatase|nr:histidine phosphatase family protein [Rhodocyclaceae bacterium]MCA3134741.1 histidine phosphatase family protein [Rhodocyclaceae bacterium]MCA3141099.1 histidine phosphatase family protein [Rhodocyclaceae bacterium]MCA3146592.1 histidine phosphatase family protein [Rhodocyclaceae bacterium]MCE2898819.1 histidine phosphatase family protein [Betaproteobacteria bacterium]
MELLLWRHAEARDGLPDLQRPLTDKGRRQAAALARWLEPRLPHQARILVSPAVRTRETVAALARDFEVVPALAPGAAPEAVLAAAGWPEAHGAALVVGHQPTLGQVASLLLAGRATDFSVKKGALWWLALRVRGDSVQVVLRAVMNPDLLD